MDLTLFVMFIGAGAFLGGAGYLLFGLDMVTNAYTRTVRATMIAAGVFFLAIGPTLLIMSTIAQRTPLPK